MTGDAIPYMTRDIGGALGELAAWFANAASVLARIGGEYRRSGASGACAVSGAGRKSFTWPLLLPARADQADPRQIAARGPVGGKCRSGGTLLFT